MTDPTPLQQAAQLACVPRSRGQLLAALDSLDVEHRPEWQPGYWPQPPGFKAGATWCSRAVEAACEKLEAHLPKGLLANQQQLWLESPDGVRAGWTEINAQQAAERAEAGFPTVGTFFKMPNGHVLMATPAIDGSGLHAWQAGGRNFSNRPIRSSFTEEQLKAVRWFTHE